ncbi:FadR/GntR family transcriptional regulator [Desulfosporosinus fructosivorans]|uniref:FadR/GntR family transcriptional regulator n=1 Tax=Desulfosporosinus fructosivorans TaxID=2018669 RepID=UPI00130EE917|nr:FadR/GntR family transcriptional regulator [Desulfosporosinus fructosivorans]
MRNNKLLSVQIANNLRGLIISRQLNEGDKLPTETELSETLEVSRITIREAVKHLCSEGALEIRRGIGTFVCNNPGLSNDPLGLDYLRNEDLPEKIYQVRFIMEPQIAKLAAKCANDEDIAEIEKSFNKFKFIANDYMEGKLTRKEASIRYVDNEIAFHMSICASAKNDVLDRIMFIILEAYMEKYYSSIDFIGDTPDWYKSHNEIIEAIKSRDPDCAETAVKNHLEFGQDYKKVNLNY